MRALTQRPSTPGLVLALTLIACAGCGASSHAPPTRPTARPPAPAGARQQVTIASFSYHPTPTRVKVGGTVTWTNQDTTEHTATADNSATFDTGTIGHGSTKTARLTTPGTVAYHCAFHPFMHGTIIVVR